MPTNLTPPPERADLDNLYAWLRDDLVPGDLAGDIEAAAAELERLREENEAMAETIALHQHDWQQLRLIAKAEAERKAAPAEPEETVVLPTWWSVNAEGRPYCGTVCKEIPDWMERPHYLGIRIDRAPVDALFATREVRGVVE